MSEPVLRVRDLRIAFPDGSPGGREVVHGIDLDVRRGRVTALVGESGSGKSVTALAVLRLLARTVRVSGSLSFEGTDLLAAEPAVLRAIRGAGIGAVFQEPMGAWNPVQTIGSQLAEALRAHDLPAGHAEIERLLKQAGLDGPERIAGSYPHQLSGGQLQRAMVAMATSCEPRLLIADEPTTALDVTVQAGVLDLLRSLAAAGTAILLITHDMGVVADLADDVVVLNAGEVVEQGSVEQVLTKPRADYTRSLLAAVPRLDAVPPQRAPVSEGAPAASLRSVTITYAAGRGRRGGREPLRAVDSVDLDLPPGRTVGLVGESGSGKSTLGRCLTGLVRPSAGSVTIGGRDVTGKVSAEDRREVGIVFQDPGSSLNPKHPVGRSIGEPLRLAGWPRDRVRARVDELLTAVRGGSGMAERYPFQLSGGQRQRIAIARALALSPRLLVADEPTSALDVSVQAAILELLTDLQRDLGFACLFISHDLAVVAAISHEVAVMRAGRILEHGPTARVLSDPADDYTRRLLTAAPVADPAEQRRRREERLREPYVG